MLTEGLSKVELAPILAAHDPAPSWVRVAENAIHDYGGGGIRVTRIADNVPSEIQIVDHQINHIAPELIR